MATGVKEIEDALADFRPGLEADGYDMEVESVSAGLVQIRIIAGPEACEECLVPQEMMTRMFLATLDHLPDISQVKLIYPGE